MTPDPDQPLALFAAAVAALRAAGHGEFADAISDPEVMNRILYNLGADNGLQIRRQERNRLINQLHKRLSHIMIKRALDEYLDRSWSRDSLLSENPHKPSDPEFLLFQICRVYPQKLSLSLIRAITAE